LSSAIQIECLEFRERLRRAIPTEHWGRPRREWTMRLCQQLLSSEHVARLFYQSLRISGNKVRANPALALELVEQISSTNVLGANEGLLDGIPRRLEVGNEHPVGAQNAVLDRQYEVGIAAEWLAATSGQPEILGIDPQLVQWDGVFRCSHREIEVGFQRGKITLKADFKLAGAGGAEQQVGPLPQRLDIRLCGRQGCNTCNVGKACQEP